VEGLKCFSSEIGCDRLSARVVVDDPIEKYPGGGVKVGDEVRLMEGTDSLSGVVQDDEYDDDDCELLKDAFQARWGRFGRGLGAADEDLPNANASRDAVAGVVGVNEPRASADSGSG